jgi:hypothetical protein
MVMSNLTMRLREQIRVQLMNRKKLGTTVIACHHFQMNGGIQNLTEGSSRNDPTLLEDLGLEPESIAQQYHDAIEAYINGKIAGDAHAIMKRYTSAKNVLSVPVSAHLKEIQPWLIIPDA